MSYQADTSGGRVQGKDAGDHLEFLGIPYAAPPTGQARFSAPRARAPWTDVLDATGFGLSCPQASHRVQGMSASGPQGEDCLRLNVYTPACDGKRRPVLFWIHGGGFNHGSGSEPLYAGGPLVERGDVVVVTIHYRLAALGYCVFSDAVTNELGLSANCGQLDQVAALGWVRDNIAVFGGDPGNVTLFGESAGSAAVGALLAMPSAKGLFHKAIMQSGTARAAPRDVATKLGDEVLRELGAVDTPQHLQTVPVEEIVAAGQAAVAAAGRGFGPVVDGVVIPEDPWVANETGRAADVPLLIGTNRDEAKLFNVYRGRPEMDAAALLTGVIELTGADEAAARSVIAEFSASREAHGLSTAPVDLYDGIHSVWWMRQPGDAFALAHARHQPATWSYLFTWESPAMRGALGACHALEMPFVFGTLDAPTQDRFAGTGPVAELLSTQMMDAWLAFARNGNPEHPSTGAWPAYTADERPTMIFGAQSGIEHDPFAGERRAIEVLRQG